MRSNFEEKRANRQARYEALAEKFKNESAERYARFKRIADFIPFGQPILIGHHSEGRHRRDIDRMNSNMRKSIEADHKAEHYEHKAGISNNTISTDDPEALTKLRDKLAALERNQLLMKACNKVIKGKGTEAEKVEKLNNLGLTTAQALEVMRPGYVGRLGFQGFKLTNNNANINNVKKRIAQLEALNSREDNEYTINRVKVIENATENRVQIFFDSIPLEAVRTKLKRSGFRWSPSNGCWQAYFNNHSIWSAKRILEAIPVMGSVVS